MGTVFKFRDATMKRCQVINLDERIAARFTPVSLEFFHFLYLARKIDFSIWFRAGNLAVEYIKPEELSKQLIDEIWEAMQKPHEGLEVLVLKSDRRRFDHLIETIRAQKLAGLLKKLPYLDTKTVDLYANLSTASQMIVSGGIDQGVVEKVKASAAFLVSNMIDSDAAIATLSRMITCDPTLYDHSASVAMIAAVIGQRMVNKSLNLREAELLAQCALYHDVGKTCVPSNILNKPGKLDDEEFRVMKQHAELGYLEIRQLMREGVDIDLTVARVALEHHEKWNGRGYPHGKKGALENDEQNGIHLFTRIVTISDIYSALLMKRVYKPAFEPQDAIKIMAEEREGFDPAIFLPFLKGVISSLNAEAKAKAKGRVLQLDNNDGVVEWSDLASQKPSKSS